MSEISLPQHLLLGLLQLIALGLLIHGIYLGVNGHPHQSANEVVAALIVGACGRLAFEMARMPTLGGDSSDD